MKLPSTVDFDHSVLIIEGSGSDATQLPGNEKRPACTEDNESSDQMASMCISVSRFVEPLNSIEKTTNTCR